MCRRQLVDAPQNTIIAHHIAECEILFERPVVDFGGSNVDTQRFQLGGESDTSPRPLDIKQRLLAEPIAYQQQPLAQRVPERKGEHPVKADDALVAPSLVGLEYDLGITAGAKDDPTRREFLAQFKEIVNLTVVGNP